MNCSFNAVELASVVERSVSIIRAQLLDQLRTDYVPLETTSLLGMARELAVQVDQVQDRITAEIVGKLLDSVSTLSAVAPQAAFTNIHRSLDLLTAIEQRFLNFNPDVSQTDIEIDLLENSLTAPLTELGSQAFDDQETITIDSELLDIFRDEAEDLLRNIESCLNALATNTGNEAALWEIRRHAHTFKGSAAIVGFLDLSKLAHALEDRVELFASEPKASKFSTLGSIKESFAALRSRSVTALFENLKTSAEVSDLTLRDSDPFVHLLSSTPKANSSISSQNETITAAQTTAEPLHVEPRDTILRVPTSRLGGLDLGMRELELSRRELERESRQIRAKNEEMIAQLTRLLGQKELNRHDQVEVSALADVRKKATDIGQALRSLELRTSGDVPRTSKLRTEIEELLMVEFGTIKARLERTARVTAEETDRFVELRLEDGSALIDADTLAKLTEPLLHLIRNAVVHGLESPDTRRFLGKKEIGTVFVSYSRSDTVFDLYIRDDGCGIDQARLRKKALEFGIASESELNGLSESELQSLIFEVGLTTAQSLTMNAGRGVGMSIVKRGVESLGGSIRISSIAQTGTEFRLRIPLLRPTINVNVYRSGGMVFAVQSDLIISSVRNTQNDKFSSQYIEFIAEKGNGKILVEEILERSELLTSSRSNNLKFPPGILGYGSVSEGSTIPIVDVDHLFEHGLPTIENLDEVQIPSIVASGADVLVVDDSPSARARNVSILTRQGFKVAAVSSGNDAIEWLSKAETLPALLVTDIEMPEMDGFELIRSIRDNGKYSRLPAIIVSTRNDDEHKRIANQLGVADLLVKPVDEEELISVAKEIILVGSEKPLIG